MTEPRKCRDLWGPTDIEHGGQVVKYVNVRCHLDKDHEGLHEDDLGSTWA